MTSDQEAMMFKAAFIVLGVGWLPILAYGLFGPADGNPIGLGLLAWASTPVAMVLFAIGAVARIVLLLRS